MTAVAFELELIVVSVRLRRFKLVCPHCEASTWERYDTRPVESAWRALDLGAWRVTVHARLRRLNCPEHGVVTEGVPFARVGSRFVADFEDLVVWLASRTDKTSVARLCRIDWRTVGAIVARVVDEELDPGRLDGLYDIGIDEVSCRKGHKYLTVVTDHGKGKVVWTGEGRDADTPRGVLRRAGRRAVGRAGGGEHGHEPGLRQPRARARVTGHDRVGSVSCGGVGEHRVGRGAPSALEHLRAHKGTDAARKLKGARWALHKRPESLSERQAETLAELERAGGRVWRAYQLNQALRAVFAAGLTFEEAAELLDRSCHGRSAAASTSSSSWAARSASTATASSRLSGWGSATPAPRRSTPRSSSSSAALGGSTA